MPARRDDRPVPVAAGDREGVQQPVRSAGDLARAGAAIDEGFGPLRGLSWR